MRHAELSRIESLRGAQPAQLDRLVREAVDGGLLHDDGHQLTAAQPAEDEPEEESGPTERPADRPVRVVAIDFESVVRTTAAKPYVERRAFQIAALRFGRDRAWVNERRSMSRYCTLPDTGDEPAWQITSPVAAAAHAAGAVDAELWLADLDDVLEGCDMVVAYNGLELDFPLLDQERARAGLPPLSGVELVDGLLLALSVWPNPPNDHRLGRLAARIELDMNGYTWHEALSDCRLLAAVILEAARILRSRLDPGLVDLILSLCDDSPAWTLVADLVRMAPSGRRYDDEDVAELLGTHLDALPIPRRRQATTGSTSTPIDVPTSVLDADGRVDPHLLAEMIRDSELERRPAQGQMADLVAQWMGEGHGGLIEAPTGTGKSLVLLASALDWTRADPERRAVIATHTKQLQSQLARDVQDLVDAGLGALTTSADLVKGASNRLSLRALTLELADGANPDVRRAHPTDQAYRELLAYLTMRFVTATTVTERWLARSVDVVDVPMVFATTTRRMLPSWLATLSQHDQGEYGADPDLAFTMHTDRVAESLSSSRIVIANHALLLAHRDDFTEIGAGLAVFVDEAHELESAATGALSANFDYQVLERIPSEITRFAAEADAHDAIGRLLEGAGQLRRFLEAEVLPNATLRVLDLLSEPGSEAGRRSATIASPYSGIRGNAPVDGLRHSLARAGRYLDFMRGMLGWWAADPDGLIAADRWAAERFRAAASSVLAQNDAIGAITADLDLLLGPLTRRMVRIASSGDDLTPPPPDGTHDAALAFALDLSDDRASRPGPDATSEPVDVAVSFSEVSGTASADVDPVFLVDELARIDGESDASVDDGVLGTAALSTDADDADDAPEPGDDAPESADAEAGPAGAGAPPPAEGNKVVWIAEAESPDVARSRRRLRFSVTTSPILLGRAITWREFLADTPRLILTSGTLQVADSWDFIRRRLGLDEHMPAEVLESPFNYATQARLVALADFPSWVEHPTRAVRTVAHQIGGWMRLVARPYEAGGMAGGAMVLTTSKASAAAISEAVAPLLAGAGVPLATTETLGNARAVERFVADGGVLVGTRGLWQGVDVADPERLRLVWINKLPFASFADPIIAARRAAETERARLAEEADPERSADESYYLPLAALALRQAVGRLIRTTEHRGVIVIGDAKLAGSDARRRLYRRVFLGSLEHDLHIDGPGGDVGAGNVMPMTDAWREIIRFGAECGFVDANDAAAALEPGALDSFVDLPEMAAIRVQILDPDGEVELRAGDPEGFVDAIVARCQAVASVLAGAPVTLRDEQRRAIAAIAAGDDLLALLPTGFGKSYCYQLPGLVLSGVTVVVSPLVSLMVDQAMGLGATIGSMVRALTGPMRESNSRLGKTQVAETLRGEADHGIRLIYLSPERLADARFRALIETAVERGIVRRIAVDEAHTLVDWGDDFRPAFRRLDRWLAGVRERHPGLALSAFTATANETVREGIRARIFGVDSPGADDVEAGLVTVEATPLRPELAIWRRRLVPGGPNAVAGLVEAVTDALDQHAIFYCLTVREVERLYASLRDYLGDEQADRVMRYHGQLSQAEKAAVALAFRTAPRSGEDGFRPMIVVATSAFGLGVDRDDIRCVFCVSPPTDLAALYQQLGRAGRDSARLVPGTDEVSLNAAMALVTQRSWSTATWMANQDLNINTLRGLGDRYLQGAPPGSCAVMDPGDIAQAQIDADVDAHRLSENDRTRSRVADEYRSGAMRALAALSATGGLEDLGDIPDRVRLTPGELACDDELWQEVIATALDDLGAATSGADLVELHGRLAQLSGYAGICPEVTDLWTGLAAAHDWGWLDVSQQVTVARLVVFRVLQRERPAGFDSEVTSRRERVNTELNRLRDWFSDTRCAHQGFADAFGVGELPPGTCAVPPVRCSSHWNDSGTLASEPAPQPSLYRAFFTPRPQPSAATAQGRANFERRLRRHISDLLWQEYRGLTARMLHRVLRGEDWWYSVQHRRWYRLKSRLLYHRLRGSMVGVRIAAIEAALAQLADEGRVVDIGNRKWRWAEHVATDAARTARQAAAAQQGAGTAQPGTAPTGLAQPVAALQAAGTAPDAPGPVS